MRSVHVTAVTLKLKRGGRESTRVCYIPLPEPYQSLLLDLQGLAKQERLIYLHEHVDSAPWIMDHEIADLRRGRMSLSSSRVDYGRYVPMARGIVRDSEDRSELEMIFAARVIGAFKVESELESLHGMALDPRAGFHSDVVWVLGQIHDKASLAVLLGVTSDDGRLELIKWDDEALPHIGDLIRRSTDNTMDDQQRGEGQSMIRAYVDHWNELSHPVDPAIIEAVQHALDRTNSDDENIGTEVHQEFLRRAVPDQKPEIQEEPGKQKPLDAKRRDPWI